MKTIEDVKLPEIGKNASAGFGQHNPLNKKLATRLEMNQSASPRIHSKRMTNIDKTRAQPRKARKKLKGVLNKEFEISRINKGRMTESAVSLASKASGRDSHHRFEAGSANLTRNGPENLHIKKHLTEAKPFKGTNLSNL